MKEFATLLVREKILQQIFLELNNFTDLKPSIDIVLKYIKVLSTCSSIGVRLLNESGAPYYTYTGFTEDFIEHENDICLYSKNGDQVFKENGTCILQCMCGVILNEIPENSTLLTSGGSFWTNNSTTFLDNVSEQEKKDLNIRSYCNACGYESIALVPIKYENVVIGLLQLNDREIDKFNEELIYYLEMVGSQLGISIRNRKMYTDLLMKYNELQATCIK